jgi:hypothetical protein
MPTVWMNIPQTIWVGEKSGWKESSFESINIFTMYREIAKRPRLFELRYDLQMITSFEKKYGEKSLPSGLGDGKLPPETRAVHYFLASSKENPERLPEIITAVRVRKKVHGNKREEDLDKNLKPA